MNRTRITSARIINSDESTTELVAERPTPAVPPLVRIPWKHETKPMIKPNTAVLKVGGRKSLRAASFRPLCRNKRKVMGCDNVVEIHPRKMPEASATRVSNGSMHRHARTRVDARNLYGLTAETSIAS